WICSPGLPIEVVTGVFIAPVLVPTPPCANTVAIDVPPIVVMPIPVGLPGGLTGAPTVFIAVRATITTLPVVHGAPLTVTLMTPETAAVPPLPMGERGTETFAFAMAIEQGLNIQTLLTPTSAIGPRRCRPGVTGCGCIEVGVATAKLPDA